MKKIILDLRNVRTIQGLHAYLAQEFGFPSYYGRNLDALYDMLTEISEDTCVGVFVPEGSSGMTGYVGRVCEVMSDAERENMHLAVIILYPRA